jgi:hypothetical protein
MFDFGFIVSLRFINLEFFGLSRNVMNEVELKRRPNKNFNSEIEHPKSEIKNPNLW